jgi:hypothetical protein
VSARYHGDERVSRRQAFEKERAMDVVDDPHHSISSERPNYSGGQPLVSGSPADLENYRPIVTPSEGDDGILSFQDALDCNSPGLRQIGESRTGIGRVEGRHLLERADVASNIGWRT